jgi:excisionase family DNA binding protein
MKKRQLLELPPVKDVLRTIPEAARILHVSERTVERMIKDGTLKSRRVGKRCRRIRDSVILKYMGNIAPDEQAVANKPPTQISFLVTPREG